jgi:hypothetical protein
MPACLRDHFTLVPPTVPAPRCLAGTARALGLGMVVGPDPCALLDCDATSAGAAMPSGAGTFGLWELRGWAVAATDARDHTTPDALPMTFMASTRWMLHRGVGQAPLVSRRVVGYRNLGWSYVVPCTPAGTNPPGVARCAP